MALTKLPYVSGKTVITAENLNAIQESVIALENSSETAGQTFQTLSNLTTTIDANSTNTQYPSAKAAKAYVDAACAAVSAAGVVVDSALSTSSQNPVQNSIITAELNKKLSTSGGSLTGKLEMNQNDISNIGWMSIVDPDGGEGVYFNAGYNLNGPYLEILGSLEDAVIQLNGIATPTSNYQAANKKYVDDQIATVSSSGGSSSGSYLPLSGGTLTGDLVLSTCKGITLNSEDYAFELEGAGGTSWYEEIADTNEEYMNTYSENMGYLYLNRDGSQFSIIAPVTDTTGSKKAILFSNIVLGNVADPINPRDVATKQYVDNLFNSLDATGVKY